MGCDVISESQREVLLDIFENTERLDKISISTNKDTKTVTVVYEDIDEQWFFEVEGDVIKLDKVPVTVYYL